MEYIKSKFTGLAIYAVALMSFCLWVFMLFFVRGIKTFSGLLSDYLILLLLVVLLFFVLNIFKSVKYIIIKGDKLTYYSFCRPFGKTLYFSDYVGKIVFRERSAAGSYSVVYLIDKKNRTVCKLMGLHYKNFGWIISAIPLRTMDFKPTMKDDFKLFFGGRITIKEGSNEKNAQKKRNKFMIAVQIAAVIGMSLMILGYLTRWLLG